MQTQPPADSQEQAAANAEGETENAGQSAPITLTITPELLAALGVPADQATPESVANAIAASAQKAASADTLAPQVSDLQSQLAAAQKQIADAAAAKAAEELAEQLAGYDLDEPATAAMTALPPEHRAALLAKMPKKAGAPGASAPAAPGQSGGGLPQSKIPPPPPIHDPNAKPEQTPAERAAEAEKLIAEIRKAPGTKFPGYSDAREEARRRSPQLFA